jgi:hypothetical protein
MGRCARVQNSGVLYISIYIYNIYILYQPPT